MVRKQEGKDANSSTACMATFLITSKAMKTVSDMKAMIEAFKLQGIKSVRDITAALNAHKIATPQGKQWHRTSVYQLLKRMDKSL